MMFVLLVLIGYLIGSIPSGYLAMRCFTGSDIRLMGTGNTTVTAVMIYGGKLPGIVAFLGEIAKAIILFFIAKSLVGEPWAVVVLIIAAGFGCSWSIWLRGNGGQGLSIGIAGLVLINPLPVLITAFTYLVPLLTIKNHVLSGRIFRASFPPILGIWYTSWEWALAGLLIVAPSLLKAWVSGDDVEVAKEAKDVGHSSAGV